MAVMNTLRNKMGKVVVGLIAFAIISFVLTDLLGGKHSIFNKGNDREIGVIAGKVIKVDEYQKLVDNMITSYKNNFGRSPGATEQASIQNQAWQVLIGNEAFQKEYDALGLKVGEDELVDMVQGKNISPDIKRIFTNPTTGQFDKEQLIKTLAQLDQTVEGRTQWNDFEQNLIPGRLHIKLDNLLSKSVYVTEEEAKKDYYDQIEVAEVKYLYVPNYAINDSVVSVTDDELLGYLNVHKDDYKVDWSRSIKFVSYPIIPTTDDSLVFLKDIKEIKKELEEADNDSLYARANTDGDDAYQTYNMGNLPDLLKSNLNILKKGDVLGPYIDGKSYAVYKISDIVKDTVGYARASHILIKWEDESALAKNKAKKEAEQILRQLRAGADFAELAKEKSKDGASAIHGGDLNWFAKGAMVPPFNDAVFGRTTPGLVNHVVESQFGYHIIKVTEAPTYLNYKVAIVTLDIVASDETRDKSFRKADYFAGTSDNLSDFENNAERDSLVVQEAEDIKQNDQSIPRMGNARQVVSWLFRDASNGEVSQVYELEDKYVVAVMTGEVKEGTSDLEDVRLEVEQKVKSKKKSSIIADRLKGMKGSLDEIADSFGDDADVYSSSEVRLSSYTLPTVGKAPEVIGRIFSMKSGERSLPVITENGVTIVEVENITPAPEIADYSSYQSALQLAREGRISYAVGELIKDKAKVKDERYKFY